METQTVVVTGASAGIGRATARPRSKRRTGIFGTLLLYSEGEAPGAPVMLSLSHSFPGLTRLE